MLRCEGKRACAISVKSAKKGTHFEHIHACVLCVVALDATGVCSNLSDALLKMEMSSKSVENGWADVETKERGCLFSAKAAKKKKHVLTHI